MVILAVGTCFLVGQKSKEEKEKIESMLLLRVAPCSDQEDEKTEGKEFDNGKNKKTPVIIRKKITISFMVIMLITYGFVNSIAYGYQFYDPICVCKNMNQFRSGIDFVDEDKIFRVEILEETEGGYFRFETEACDMDSYIVDIFEVPVGMDFSNTSSIIDTLPKVCTLDGGNCYMKLAPGKYYAVLRQIKATEYNPVYTVVTAVSALKR